jgi:hypothetical protein
MQNAVSASNVVLGFKCASFSYYRVYSAYPRKKFHVRSSKIHHILLVHLIYQLSFPLLSFVVAVEITEYQS